MQSSDSHHNLSIASEFLKPATKIRMEVMSLVPKQAAQIQEPLASFPQWNWDRKEAGSNDPSRKHSLQLRQEWTWTAASMLQRCSCSKPVTQALEATLGCHWGPWHPSYPLVLKKMFASSNHFPYVPAHSYVQEPIFALFKALLGKGAVRPNFHSLPGSWWIEGPTRVPVSERKPLISPPIKGWHLQCQIPQLLCSKNIHRRADLSSFKMN